MALPTLDAYRQAPMTTRRRPAGTGPSPALTIALATRQARRHVDRIMPGVFATVDSRGGWDMDTDRQTVITITFPATHPHRGELGDVLAAMPDKVRMAQTAESFTITRTVKA